MTTINMKSSELEAIDPSDLVRIAGGRATVPAFANEVWRNGGAGDAYVSTLPMVSPRGYKHPLTTPVLTPLGRSGR